MFRCQRCAEVTPPRTPATELVIETRARSYPQRRYQVRGEKKERVDPGGEGVEIARVIRVCPRCASAA